MSDFLRDWFENNSQPLVAILDVLVVAYVVYRLLKLVRGKRAWRIVFGLIVFVVALVLSDKLGFSTLYWMLDKATVVAPIAIVVLFLPELRQAVEGVGRLGGWTERLITAPSPTSTDTVSQLCSAASQMAESRIGALIVIERGTLLQDIAESGVAVNAKVTAPLLGAIFYHGNPLHDGAVVVRGDRIVAAACQLPMSETGDLSPNRHMRHRAALGMSEQSDALVIVVSEERGEVSLAMEGVLKTVTNEEDLRRILARELFSASQERSGLPRHRRARAKRRQHEEAHK